MEQQDATEREGMEDWLSTYSALSMGSIPLMDEAHLWNGRSYGLNECGHSFRCHSRCNRHLRFSRRPQSGETLRICDENGFYRLIA